MQPGGSRGCEVNFWQNTPLKGERRPELAMYNAAI